MSGHILRRNEFEKIMDEFLEKNDFGLSDEDKQAVKQRVLEAIVEACPNGLSSTEVHTDEFKKKLTLAFVAAVAMERDPNLKLGLSLILKERDLIPDEELRNAFKELLTHINELRPPSIRASKEQVDAAVEEIMGAESPKEIFDDLLLERLNLDAVHEKMEENFANLSGGVDQKGFVRENAVKRLEGNIKGISVNFAVYLPRGSLADEAIPDPLADQAVNALIRQREATLGIMDMMSDAIEVVTHRLSLHR